MTRRTIELCRAADVAVGTPLRVEAEGLVVAVFNLDGEYFVTDRRLHPRPRLAQ
jgi:nitrite reductase/ring-hydroxylating ferredoxin subunit